MTPQEEQLLNSLISRVNQTQLQEKDPDAEALLNRSLAANPDAIYILAQTVLVQNIALEQARAQVTQLQQQTQPPARATSFLGSLLGHRDPAPTSPHATTQQGYQTVDAEYVQAPPQYAQPQNYAQPQYAPTVQPSFLRGAMQTAAGVAAGALAFEGVESVLHGLGGFGHSGLGWGGGGFGMGGGFERPVEETVINNYYDEPSHGGEHHSLESGEHHFHESADQSSGQGGAQFSDANYNTSDDDRNELDDSGTYDDSSADGGSGFDDSGGGSDSGSDLL